MSRSKILVYMKGIILIIGIISMASVMGYYIHTDNKKIRQNEKDELEAEIMFNKCITKSKNNKDLELLKLKCKAKSNIHLKSAKLRRMRKHGYK
jgi:hypothetical protein